MKFYADTVSLDVDEKVISVLIEIKLGAVNFAVVGAEWLLLKRGWIIGGDVAELWAIHSVCQVWNLMGSGTEWPLLLNLSLQLLFP